MAFNLLDPEGSFLGYSAFNRICQMNGVTLRVGCFCNLGGCQHHLGTTDQDTLAFHKAGHKCGSPAHDVIEGKVTGAIRASFGCYSRSWDVDILVTLVRGYCLRDPKGPLQAPKGKQTPDSPRLVSVYLYPVKSCGPMAVDTSWPVSRSGLAHDRTFVIMQGTKVLTQKTLPMLCLVQPRVNLALGQLTLTYEGEPPLVLDLDPKEPLEAQGDMCTTRVCRDKVVGQDMGPEATEWLENVTGILDLKLVKVRNRSSSSVKSAANDSQFLALNLASVQQLQERIDPEEQKGNTRHYCFSIFPLLSLIALIRKEGG